MSSYNNNIEAAIAASLKEAKEAANLNEKESKALQNAINTTKMNAHRALQKKREEEKTRRNTALREASNRSRHRSKSRNRNLMFLDNTSLDAIEEFIRPSYPPATVRIEDDISRMFNFPPNSAKRMFSSGASNDCLIHSFLTVISKNFRSLNQDDKNKTASHFRREILPKLALRFPYVFLNPEKLMNFIKDCKSQNFLETTDATIIATFFRVNILMLEPPRQGYPVSANFIEAQPFHKNGEPMPRPKTTFVIYGSGIHFSGVCINGKYEYDYDSAIAKANEMMGLREDGEDPCKIKRGTHVTYMGNIYTIIDAKKKDNKCDKYIITKYTGDSLKQFLEFSKTENITEAYGDPGMILEVDANSVSVISHTARGGRRFKTRRVNLINNTSNLLKAYSVNKMSYAKQNRQRNKNEGVLRIGIAMGKRTRRATRKPRA